MSPIKLDKRGSAGAAAAARAWSRYRELQFERLMPTTASAFSDTLSHQVAKQIATLAKATDVDRLRQGISHVLAREWGWTEKQKEKIWRGVRSTRRVIKT